MTTIAERVAQAREALGITQVQLAHRAGVTPGTIGNLESGIRKSPRELLAIAEALGRNPLWLKTGKGPEFVGPTVVHTEQQHAPYDMPGPLPRIDMRRVARLTAPQRNAIEAGMLAAAAALGVDISAPTTPRRKRSGEW